LIHAFLEVDVQQRIGAKPYGCTPTRANYRNGVRHRDSDTRVGTLHRRIPPLRRGSYCPDFLELQRRAEQALVAVIHAYVHGVSTRKVDELAQALGMTGVSKREVACICAGLDERDQAFRQQPLERWYPSLRLHATYVKVREGDRVHRMALVVATGVRPRGQRGAQLVISMRI